MEKGKRDGASEAPISRYEIFEDLPCCAIVYEAMDRGGDFVIKYLNKRCAEVENVSRDNAVGKRVTEVFPGVKEFGIFDVFHRVWRTGVAEDFPIRLYKDKRISGWRSNRVVRLRSGEIAAFYEDAAERKALEEELRSNNEALTAIAKNVADVLWRLDKEGRFIYVSPAVEAVYGYSPEEIVGTSVFAYFRKEDAGKVSENIGARGGSDPSASFPNEYEILAKDGSLIPVEVLSAAIRDGTGVIVGYAGVTRDLRPMKRAETRAADLAKYPEENPNPVMQIGADGVMLYVNKAGGDVARECGMEVGEAVPSYWRSMVSTVLAGAVPAAMDIKQGGRYYLVTAAPLPESGYVNLYWSDITERKMSERALQRNEERFRALVENSSDVIIVVSNDGKIMYSSPTFAEVFGTDPSEFINTDIQDYISSHLHPDDVGGALEAFADCLGTPGRSVRYEYRFRSDGGAWRHFVSIATNHLGTRGIDGIVVNLRDITTVKHHEFEILNLNSLLLAIRNVNQAIVREPNFDRLLQESCKILGEVRDYIDVAIAYEDSGGKLSPIARWGAHGGRRWPSVEGEYSPPCIRMMLATKRAIVADPDDRCCVGCDHCEHDVEHRSAHVPMLGRGGEVRGAISVCVEAEREISSDELALLEEVAGDLVFANEKITAEGKLAESEARYRFITENMTDSVVIMDTARRITYASPSTAKMLGCALEAVIGTSFDEHLTRESSERTTALFGNELVQGARSWDGGQVTRAIELEFCRKDGGRFWTEVMLTTFHNQNEIPTKILGVWRDITERRRVQEEMLARKTLESRYTLTKIMTDVVPALLTMGRGEKTREEFITEMMRRIDGAFYEKYFPRKVETLSEFGDGICALMNDMGGEFSWKMEKGSMQIQGAACPWKNEVAKNPVLCMINRGIIERFAQKALGKVSLAQETNRVMGDASCDFVLTLTA